MRLLFVSLLVLAGAVSIRAQVEEVVPGFYFIERVDLSGGNLGVGDSKDSLLRAAGPGLRLARKPKKYTTEKLLREMDLARSLAPQFPTVFAKFSLIAEACGVCTVENWEFALGKKDKLTFMVMTPETGAAQVALISLDRDRALMRTWRTMAIEDGLHGGTYFVSDDGTFRILRYGSTFKIERMPDKGVQR